MFLLAAAGSLLMAGPAVAPPNVPIVYKPESVADCERKGTITIDMMQIHMDQQDIRSPEMRMAVAKLGGNALLLLPGRSPSNSTPAGVYYCAKLKPTPAPAPPPPPKR